MKVELEVSIDDLTVSGKFVFPQKKTISFRYLLKIQV